MNDTQQAIDILNSSKKKIIDHLQKVIKSGAFNYRTFGTAIEEHLSEILVQIWTQASYIKGPNDFATAPAKNDFPDFTLKLSSPLAIEFKSGNKSQFHKNRWVQVKNSENDMGTLNKWPTKIAQFGGSNIYYIFVTYNFNDQVSEILDVEIGPFYQFLHITSNGVLKYREKDGNLRPKNFDAKPTITSLEQFMELLGKTNIYRSTRVIKKHKQIIKDHRDS